MRCAPSRSTRRSSREIQQSSTLPPSSASWSESTLLGLCAAGVLAGILMQREMLNARIDQTKSIVEVGAQHGARLQKQVDAGKLTKEAAIAEFAMREHDDFRCGAGYLFASTMEGVTLLRRTKLIGTDPLDVNTGDRNLVREWRDGVAAKGENTLAMNSRSRLGRAHPQAVLRRRDPRLEHVRRHRRLSRRSRRQAEADMWALGLAILAIGAIAGLIALIISRSITTPLGQLGAECARSPMASSTTPIPGIERGDEVGEDGRRPSRCSRTTRSGSAAWKRSKPKRSSAPRTSAARRWTSIANDFERSVNGIVQLGVLRPRRNADHRAVDDRDRQRCRPRAPHGRRGVGIRLQHRRHGRRGGRRTVDFGRRDRPSGGAVARDRRPGGERRRAHQRDRAAGCRPAPRRSARWCN